jgi:hypothetical protein
MAASRYAAAMATAERNLNLQNASAVCEVLEEAAEANLHSPMRSGSLVGLPDQGQLLISGDVHDNRDNFRKIIAMAQLDKSQSNHLLLQELVHSDRLVSGKDFSYRLMVEAANLSLLYPGQVHVLLSNHELAQANNEDISKYGISLVQAFDAGLDYAFGDDADEVREAIDHYVRSLPLAVRCTNGILCAHSLPSPFRQNAFDPMVLTRPLSEEDFASPIGSAYLMVWGRNLTQEWSAKLAGDWNVSQFVLGHQPADMGYDTCGENMLIVTSDHSHGVVLPIDLAQEYDRDGLIERIIPLAAIGAVEPG